MRVLVLPQLGHSLFYFFIFWAAAFVTLGLALIAASIFSSIIESDFELGSLRKEGILAAVASAIEAAFAWLIGVYAPAGVRGMLLPLVIVALLYHVAHYDTWSRYDPFLLILFQITIFIAGSATIQGHFLFALFVVGVLIVFLVIFGAIAKSL